MSLREPVDYAIPDETAALARAIFPKGTPIMRMRDAYGPLFFNADFAHLYSREGAPAYSPARLSLITIFQFAQNLADVQAGLAVGARIDWKYALALPLEAPPIDPSVLVEFRARLITGDAEFTLFSALLERFTEEGLLRRRGRQRTDATHVLAAIRLLGRLECIGETLRHALDELARVAPDFLRRHVPVEWFGSYAQPFDSSSLPQAKDKRTELAECFGQDGRVLLSLLERPDAPAGLLDLPAVKVLRQVWQQQFSAAAATEPLRLREAADLPDSAELICSPFDPQARFSVKRGSEWTGYKVHLTETCDEDLPNLITDVQTTVATTPDSVALVEIQKSLAERNLSPSEQIVDAGYVSAENLVSSQREGIDLVGPARGEGGWQAQQEGGITTTQFVIDWEAQQVSCPGGKTSTSWSASKGRKGQEQISVAFAKSDCSECGLRAGCVRSKSGRRTMTLLPQTHYEALVAARLRQQAETFTQKYRIRAGIEGTIAQGSRLADLHRSRYRGLAKTRLLHILIATALNFLRVAAWLVDRAKAQTRQSAFARLSRLAA